MIAMLVASLIAFVTVDFTTNDAELTKDAYEAACTAGGGTYTESNSESCPGLIFGTGPTPTPQAE